MHNPKLEILGCDTFCDIGSGANIMAKVTKAYLFGNEPLYPTYMQLQMAD
jgi:hypothetical protein